jgi:hypothetical protein
VEDEQFDQLRITYHAEATINMIDPNAISCIVTHKNFQYLADTWKLPSVLPAVLKVTDIAACSKREQRGGPGQCVPESYCRVGRNLASFGALV